MLEDIRDVQGPVELPASPIYIWIFLFIVLILAGIFLTIYLKNKRKRKPITAKTSWEAALAQLDTLAKKDWLTKGKFNEFYSELSHIIRVYIENRFQIRAPEMTTEEFLISLQQSSKLKSEHKEILKSFLTSCDMIKFARCTSTKEEGERNWQLIVQVINETKTDSPLSDVPKG